MQRNIYNNKKRGKCGPSPDFASYTLAFALQLRKKHGKNLSLGSRKVSRFPGGRSYLLW
jgi:hypothetical protein